MNVENNTILETDSVDNQKNLVKDQVRLSLLMHANKGGCNATGIERSGCQGYKNAIFIHGCFYGEVGYYH